MPDPTTSQTTRPASNLLWYARPARNWTEALPIGNGRLGAMVFGGTQHELLQLNDDTLWSGGPSDWNNPSAREQLPLLRAAVLRGDPVVADAIARKMQGPYTQSYLPLGDLHLDFAVVGEPADYRRELDLNCAVARTRFKINGVTHTREIFVSRPDEVIVARFTADRADQISFVASLTSPLHALCSPLAQDTIEMRGRAPIHVEPSYRKAADPVRYDERPDGEGMRFGAIVRAVATHGHTWTDDTGILHVEGADSVILLISTATSFNDYAKHPGSQGVDEHALSLSRLTKAASRGLAAITIDHERDHRALFDRVSLDLGTSSVDVPTDERVLRYAERGDPALCALVFQYGRYLLIASSRPGTQPANLQGIWNKELRAPWSSNWTMNINSQMNYWPVHTTNLGECHQPMLAFVGDLAINGRETARVNYGAAGWCAHHNADLWRQTAPVGHYGEGSPCWANFNLGGAWHCMDLWERHAFDPDDAYLRDVAYPLMRGAAQYCLDMLAEAADGSGHLGTFLSVSCENTFLDADGKRREVSFASTQDMAIHRDLFARCIEASAILGVDADFRERLRATRDKLVPYRVGSRGQLLEWSHEFGETEPHHRHLSHLIGAFPGDEITPAATPALAAAVRKSLELRGDESTGWSMAWKVNLWARLGDGDRAHALIGYMLRLTGSDKTNYTAGGIYANLFDAHPPFQIDGNFGVTAGIAEMLLQSHRRTEDGRRVLHMLPALPAAWPTGSVSGLRARGGFEVALAWANGHATRVTISAKRGGSCALEVHGKTLDVALAPEARFEWTG